MTINATRLIARVRTWTLVGSLTLVVVSVGALIGGAFAWLFAAIAVGANLIGYFYSDRIALRAVRAQPLTRAQAPEVHAAVRGLSARAGIPMPRLYLMPGEQPKAFATGRDPQHAAVAVTEGLLVILPLDQIKGVLAHELAHIRSRDTLVSSLAAMIAGAISAIVNVLQLSLLLGGEDDDGPLGTLGACAAILLAPLGGMLLKLSVSRQREYLADASAAELLGAGAPLAGALEEIARDRATLHVNPVNASMYIAHPLSGASASSLFATHPPVQERIRRLRVHDGVAQPSVVGYRSHGGVGPPQRTKE